MTKTLLTAIPAVFLLLDSITGISASAKSDIAVSIDQVSVSKYQLEADNYEVPLFVRLEQNVNLNAFEFGIDIDSRCRCTPLTRSDYSERYGEPLSLDVSCTNPDIAGYSWVTWAQVTPYFRESSNLLMLLVKIPESAQIGDVYEIRYLSQAPNNESKIHLWYNYGINTNYAVSGSVTWADGSVTIIEGEPLTEPFNIVKGDANLDGEIDIMDVILINKAIFGKADLTDEQIANADINGDSVPDSSDSLAIMKHIIKLELLD